MNGMTMAVILIIIILLVLITVMFFSITDNTEESYRTNFIEVDSIKDEIFKDHITVHNFLPNHSIRVVSNTYPRANADQASSVQHNEILAEIKPGNEKNIPADKQYKSFNVYIKLDTDKSVIDGIMVGSSLNQCDTPLPVDVNIESNGLKQFLGNSDEDGWIHFAKYTINTPSGYMVKNLYIGQITSRIMGPFYDDQTTNVYNNGLKKVRIHNLTDLPLFLNENIEVDPQSVLRYTGRNHFGVPLGTLFIDRRGVFPIFRVEREITDLFYGVASDLKQPLYGGFQITFNDDPKNNWDYRFIDGNN